MTRFDALYRGLFRTGRRDWSAPGTVREVMDHLDLLFKHADAGGTDLLELGCGTGTLSFRLAGRGFGVTGLDISPVAIAVARRRYGTLARFRVHDITRPLPALAGNYDLAVDSLVLHFITTMADRIAALSFAADAVRPGGAVVIMTMCGSPRWIPPGSRFDPDTRLLMTGDVAECYYGEPAGLAGQFGAAGLRPVYTAVAPGNDQTRDQDMFLAVLRRVPRRQRPRLSHDHGPFEADSAPFGP